MPAVVPFGYRHVSPDEKKHLVRSQFDPIAGAYDLADVLLSLGLDAYWRKKAIALLALDHGERVLDVCGGTGALARLAARRVGPGGQVTVCDFNLRMMEAGRAELRTGDGNRSISFVCGDAEALCFPDSAFHAVTIGLGLRNLVRPERALSGCLRVLKPGGRLAVFEFSVPANTLLRGVYHVYSFYWMPLLGRVICGAAAPFRYLAESVRVFAPPEELARMIREAGFSDVGFQRLLNGLAVLYHGRRPQDQ